MLPDGKINKYIKSVLSIFVIGVIASPIVNIIKSPINWGELFSSNTYTIDENFINSVSEQNAAYLARELEVYLEAQGFAGAEVEIVAESAAGDTKIKNIYVNLCDLVINKNLEHIDYYTKIKELIAGRVDGIEEDKIIIYG